MITDVVTMDEFAIEGCPIRVLVEGDESKPALVLSHMLGSDLNAWDKLAAEWTRHFRVVRYDTRGHGGSGLGDSPITLARLGRDVVAILDAFGIERAHFCGCSMGGAVGQWLLVHAPARIGRAVIADSAAKLGTPAAWNGRIAAVLAEGLEPAVEPTIERWFSPVFVKRAPERIEAVRGSIRATMPTGYAACSAALRDMDLREAVRAVKHPVLVVRGADDPSVSAEDAAHLVEAMARAVPLELDARHCTMIEAEPVFAAAVAKFLTAKEPRTKIKPTGTAPGDRSKDRGSQASVEAQVEKTSARRSGGRGLVAARRPVARTAPVSGKAVAKASATRKTAARAAPASPRRAPVAATPRAAAPKLPTHKSAARKSAAPTLAKASGMKASVFKTPATKPNAAASSARAKPAGSRTPAPATARRLTERAAAAARPVTAALLRAAARKKTVGAVAKKAPGKAAIVTSPAKPATVKTAGKPVASKAAKPMAANPTIKAGEPRAKIGEAGAAKSAPAKPPAAKPGPARPPSPIASSRRAAPLAKPRSPVGRGSAGPGRRKP